MLQDPLAPLRQHVNRAFNITEKIPQEGCFLACLCTIDRQPEYSQLRLFCYPSHKQSEVRNILCSTKEAFLFGSGNSLEPLCPGDGIDVILLKGLEAHEDTEEDELRLR